MKFEVKQKYLTLNPEMFVQRFCGYARIIDHGSDQESFVYRLSRDFYPRFHLYLEKKMENGEEIVVFNLHLDQKKSGQSSIRHNAEYEGESVEREINRLKSLVIANYSQG